MPNYSTIQTNTSKALRRAGLKRFEFSARHERLYDGLNSEGQPVYSKGPLHITLKCDLIRAIELTPRIVEQGLNVWHYLDQNNSIVNVRVTIPQEGEQASKRELFIDHPPNLP